MKNVIILAENVRDNERLLVMENVNKTAMTKVVKVSSAINLNRKYN